MNEFHGPNSKFPLIEGHKNVDCTKCHPNNVFTNAPTQCGPKCHADELHKGSLGADCVVCHTGGKWEARLFDHDRDTKWPLVGNHKDVLCDSCHPRRDFAANRGKSRTCYNCHKKDDAHSGELGTRCERCHVPDGTISFDHNDPKVSDWPLAGAHEAVRCADCHKSIHFKPTPRDCGGCHGEPDVHRGQLGTLCGRCHDAKDWKTIHTRHDVPGIRFAGAHDRVSCYKCHTLGRLLEGTGPLCITCHRSDDIHNNGLGPRCGECHSQNTWAGAHFDHNTVGCNLTGIHRLTPCALCHTGGNFAALSPTCVSCHRKDAIRGEMNGGGADARGLLDVRELPQRELLQARRSRREPRAGVRVSVTGEPRRLALVLTLIGAGSCARCRRAGSEGSLQLPSRPHRHVPAPSSRTTRREQPRRSRARCPSATAIYASCSTGVGFPATSSCTSTGASASPACSRPDVVDQRGHRRARRDHRAWLRRRP